MPAAPDLTGAKRTHRIGKPEELEEETMPRKKKLEGPPLITPEEASGRKKRKYTRRKGVGGRPHKDVSELAFTVDEHGAVTITSSEATIALNVPDTKRLHGFIDRTEELRK